MRTGCDEVLGRKSESKFPSSIKSPKRSNRIPSPTFERTKIKNKTSEAIKSLGANAQ